MPICDFAEWEPLPPQKSIESMPEKYRYEQKTQFIIHSAGGGYPGSIETWKGLGYGVYSTFFILDDGSIKQLVDSSFKANANGSASLDWNTDDAFRRDTLARRDDNPFTRRTTET